jgi:AAA family ATP:ADP antiporter
MRFIVLNFPHVYNYKILGFFVILVMMLTYQGHILTVAGVTVAICASPLVAASNMVALAVWPTWVAVALTETIRKVVTYVLTRPGRELLFTVVSQDEKYKAMSV